MNVLLIGRLYCIDSRLGATIDVRCGTDSGARSHPLASFTFSSSILLPRKPQSPARGDTPVVEDQFAAATSATPPSIIAAKRCPTRCPRERGERMVRVFAAVLRGQENSAPRAAAAAYPSQLLPPRARARKNIVPRSRDASFPPVTLSVLVVLRAPVLDPHDPHHDASPRRYYSPRESERNASRKRWISELGPVNSLTAPATHIVRSGWEQGGQWGSSGVLPCVLSSPVAAPPACRGIFPYLR